MSLYRYKYIKKLLTDNYINLPITLTALKSMGISKQLLYKYVKSGWLEKLGPGAYQFPKSQSTWQSYLFALQKQLDKNIHVGGRTALEYYGLGHFLSLAQQKIFLFKLREERLPAWFFTHQSFDSNIEVISSNFLPSELGVEQEDFQGLQLMISSPERAAFEVLYLLDKHHSFKEVLLLSESFANFRPTLMQNLLEACDSKKVKRLILYLGKKHQSLWFNKLELIKLDLGTGVIQVAGGGKYDKEFKLSLPQDYDELENV
ncbi:MAG: type IV toxin-antitoxin system AbiEi family antitoxin domain-containing protein [Flavobacteriales bacterium]|nr:type IV toxin-antitoxin system AbiEi family antitoxin domain-containing protein [Flavobacteriales bacterium]